MTITAAQQYEIDKYTACYADPKYRMGPSRKTTCQEQLISMAHRGSYLDVGCGRAEMLDYARTIGFERVVGAESCETLVNRADVVKAIGWELPFEDGEFEVVSCFDVIEHILPGDDEKLCRELDRVASKAVVLTASNIRSQHNGVELHVNRRPYPEWLELFQSWFSPHAVEWQSHNNPHPCELFIVEKV